MTEIERKPALFGAIGTVVFWTLFIVLCAVFSVFAKKPTYKTIQIHLDAPRTSRQTATPAPVQPAPPAQSAPPAQPAPAAQATPPAPQPKPRQPTPAKAATKPASSASAQKNTPEPVLQKSVEELLAEQIAAKPKRQRTQAELDALFADTADEQTSAAQGTQTTRQNKSVQNALGGSAAVANGNNNTATTATSEKNTMPAVASDDTTAMLGKIAATAYKETAGNGISSTVTAQTGGTRDGKVAMQMADGSMRTLQDPAKPTISLSPTVTSLIDSKKQVQIRFTVTASGTVPISEIRITPEASLHPRVRDEITAQISKWRFSQGNTAGTAVFDYTIDLQ